MREAVTSDRAPNGWPKARLEGFRAGEEAALAWVYREHIGALAAFLRRGFSFDSRGRAMRFSGFDSRFELHDALQETFRRAFESRARRSYDGLRPYGPWLSTIARNVVLREFRRRERLFVELDGAALEAGAEGEPAAENPERALDRERVRKLVREFLETLAPEERGLLELRFVEGVAQREAAERLGLGRQRLRTREAKLRERLIRFLGARGESQRGAQPGSTTGALLWLALLPLVAEELARAGASLRLEPAMATGGRR